MPYYDVIWNDIVVRHRLVRLYNQDIVETTRGVFRRSGTLRECQVAVALRAKSG